MEQNSNLEIWKRCLAALDLTSLSVIDSNSSIMEFAGRAARFEADFPHLPRPASVCVYPSLVDAARVALKGSGMKLTSVAGGFPSSQTFIEVKALEVEMAIEAGADEVDVVIPVGMLLDGERNRVMNELTGLRRKAGKEVVMKVILESGALKTPEKIREAAMLAMSAGADFVKTSTGKIDIGATPQAARAMCLAIGEFYELTGRPVGFKVSGGVRTVDDAVGYYTIVEEILGPEWLTPRLFRIGASSLANELLSAIEGREIKYF